MSIKLKITLIFIMLIIGIQLHAQNVNCDISNEITTGPMTLELSTHLIQSGSEASTIAYFKMPIKSNEVKKADWITCKGIMPNGAKMISIKILSVEGLPEGLSWICNKEDCNYKGGEPGCVTIGGITDKKGRYPININLKGKGSLWGIKKAYECSINSLEVIVE